MSFGVIGYRGASQQQVRLDFSQNNPNQQYITPVPGTLAQTLAGGQVFILPPGIYEVQCGRYSTLQYYDVGSGRWRSLNTQPGQTRALSSDGSNWRIANLTGCPVGALISNVGNGNLTNGYNTVGVTPSAGNSTWGTLVGGSVNSNVTISNGGNYALAPLIVWQPAANQSLPFIPPEFYCNLNANGTINTVTLQQGGAGLTAPGTIQAVQQFGDVNPGGANLVLQANLNNSGNLIAMWPLTPGTPQTAVPTLTFNTGGSTAATPIMDFTVTGFTVTTAGANLGVSATAAIISANGALNATQNAAITGADYAIAASMPRMAWLSTKSESNGNLSNNGNVVVTDGGINLQAIPMLAVIPSNTNGISTNALPVLVAQVGSVVDTSFMQVI